MSKSALLIGLDRGIQVMGPFGSQPDGVPRRLRIPSIRERMPLVIESGPLEPVPMHDRTFLLMGETQAYYIYEEVP